MKFDAPSLAIILSFILISASSASATPPVQPDWSDHAKINPEGRPNPYGWDEKTLAEKVRKGKIHALQYPIEITGVLLPTRPTLKILDAKPGEPLFELMRSVLSLSKDFRDFKGFWKWLGLPNYPEVETADVPYPKGIKPLYPMGVSLIDRPGVDQNGHPLQGFTLSCATCHSGSLFGRSVIGLTNRFPRANLAFVHGGKDVKLLPASLFAAATGASVDEKAMYARSRGNIQSVGAKSPQTLGLDTALAQVTLSMAKRAQDPYAEKTKENANHPRRSELETWVADSKPSVWWNLKYKTHWGTEGGMRSGNPLFTVILWNELGRGTDLHELEAWVQRNEDVVEEMTSMIFANEAPKWKDFLGENTIHVERAKRGEALFVQNCAHCHGQYEKAWSLNPQDFARLKEKQTDLSITDTTRVKYFEKTRTVDVGTDAHRRIGTRFTAEALNPLKWSQDHGITLEEQEGYVPPPLVGIWARYPYFHNNSIPNLCALMTEPSKRPVSYYSGEAIDPNRDYDQDCVGYPLGALTPPAWMKNRDYLYDTRREGMGNAGHYEGIFTNEDGSEKYTAEQKHDLIEYLKTL